MSWMNVGGGGVASVVKLNAELASMLFGGSTVSRSVTSEASTVTVQLSENPKSTAGSRLNVVGPPLCVAVCEPLVAQLIVYQAVETSTGSLKVIAMLVLKETSVALFRGDVAVTAGALSPVQKCNGDAVLRGLGAPTAKSDALLSESVQPLSARRTAVVLLGAAVAAPSSKQFAVVPYPTRSTTAAPLGHDPLSGVATFARMTFPAVAPIAILPVASGVGRFTLPPAPGAS